MWYSMHGFIHSYQALDDYLMSDIAYYPDSFEFFFIRYWLGGPHVRLRVKIPDNNNEIRTKVFGEFQKSIQKFYKININKYDWVDHQYFYKSGIIDFEGNSDLYWEENGSVKEIPYLQEIERYGGSSSSMQYSEEIFIESSKLSMYLNKLSYEKRVIVAFELFVNSINEFFQTLNDKINFLNFYNKFWEEYKISGLQSIQYSKFKYIYNNPSNREIYVEYLKLIRPNEMFSEKILFSHLHMTNNRLGMGPYWDFKFSELCLEFMTEEG
ncbi:thiopeptide-type bacteriocin biosynthesis domain [Streptococcus pneumoniae]|uniref:lantibiotic dehydratase C-terminal domain-containing protein n=3 Tax=Streptococcus pneumoniae TaxID=1313 RepID=UPI0005DBDB7F|nr:lantibiotic dehydratase C-terminal domain-containing protein [Streptococcus pneumoniae]CKG94513.1 thiopeptide-type bacteriocin biosynthesis domain [Streptococcus pneumoniae]CKH02792.1 thiopeptide-type bacteriocin biosynthesis domain [Streptococcus pneumoniae]CKH24675.1 thiopeptide-type bacteriocin biosynthesis domain [Streptococcus pneumoniae]CKH29878.1 thiopeptide-type bacteriocin biosynthesis domain [Streptococcus pneumoniae]CKH39629.1 thiopeptide-type bacteriocin biosynthesis domain [Str